jgi:teichuronic acid biosynthesis glycosyltransferase TuaG
MKDKPKISVIVPYYKKKQYIIKTLKSVFKQSFKSFEIILVYDDQDLSDLSFIKKKFKNKNLKIIVNKTNLGAGYSRNVGIKHAIGEYISFLDADDYWYKNKLFYQLNFMQQNFYEISHTDYTIIEKKKKYRRIAKELRFKEILKSCDIGLSTVMLKKNF